MIQTNNNPSIFIAEWEKELGAKVIDFYPKSIQLDYELISLKIFTAFHNFYQSENKDKKIKRTFFKLPLKRLNRKASIFLDSIEKSDDKFQPYIVVFLFPRHVSDEEIKNFDDLIFNTGIKYLNNELNSLKKDFNKINDLFLLKEKVQDADIEIDDSYSFNDALLDFKKGIEQFSKKKYEQSYFFLKKAYLKLKSENKIKLVMETSFFLGSVLSKLNKIKMAQYYFKELESLSDQLKHQKYYENAIFMEGFCAFKIGNNNEAQKQFKKLETIQIQYINKFQFFFLYGRVLRLVNQNNKALEMLLKAREMYGQIDDSDTNKEKLAKLLLELGHTNYNFAIETVKAGKIDQDKLYSFLNNTIDYYEDSIKVWEETSNYKALIDTFQLIGNIFELTNSLSQSIDYYRQALKYAELTNDVLRRMNIFNLIIQALERLGKHNIIVKEIDEMLSKIISFAFIDLHTISRFHKQLGKSLFILGKKKEALSELLISMNIYNKFDTPVEDALTTLKIIIDIYKSSKEEKYIEFYEEQYNNLEDQINQTNNKKTKEDTILGEVKEIWVIHKSGATLFSYAPESSVDSLLFGGFLCALQSFSLELTSKRMNSITIGSDMFVFYFEENKQFFVMGRSTIKISLFKIQKILQNIYNLFSNQYKESLEKFDGNITKYHDFINEIKGS